METPSSPTIILDASTEPTEEMSQSPASPPRDAAMNPRLHREIRLLRRISAGKVTFSEFKQLPRAAQRRYTSLFGRPKTGNDLRCIAKRLAKRRRLARLARATRQAQFRMVLA
jgi:hypothetical protein